MVCALLSYLEPDFTDVPLREDQREYLCKVADGYDYIYKLLCLFYWSKYA